MLSLIKFLCESTPRNPDTIVVQNEFYSKGLTEKDIYDYYIKNKNKILKQVSDREVMLFLAADKNKFIVKRLGKDLNYIMLNKTNYNRIITGRTVSIHSTFRSHENFGIIDLDCSDFNQAKESAAEIYDLLLKFNKNLKIRYTGKDSFHILYYFDSVYDINIIRHKLKGLLIHLIPNNKKYLINQVRTKDKVNLDLSSNKFRGGFITLGSLSVMGLKCVEVSREDIMKFRKEYCKIKG